MSATASGKARTTPPRTRYRSLLGPPARPMIFIGLGLVLLGWLGLDAWFYQHVSMRLNTDRLYDGDFYERTRPFWLFVRYAFAHAVGGFVIYTTIVLLHRKHWRAANRALLAVLPTGLAVNVLQGAIGRIRPNMASSHLDFVPPLSQLLEKNAVAFPSGEAATALAIAVVLSHLWPKQAWLFYTLAAIATIARLVNGAHYVSDVVAGALLGGVLGSALFQLNLPSRLRSAAGKAQIHWERLRGARMPT